MAGDRICRSLEIARWCGVIAAFVLASTVAETPAEQLAIVAPLLVISVAGLTGIESVFCSAAAAKITGYAPSAYQRQSSFNNLALAAAAVLSTILGWGAAADAALLTVLLAFLTLSAGNHLWSAVADGNLSARSFTRPAATAGLVVATLPLLLSAGTVVQAG